MKKYLLFVSFLFVLTLLGACSEYEEPDSSKEEDCEDGSASLYNTWVLVSYENESNEVLKEVEGYYYITFNPDGVYSGVAYMRDYWGEYECYGDVIKLGSPKVAQADFREFDPDVFYQKLTDIYTYRISNKILRLYYSKDQYFKFRIKDNKS